MKYLQFVQIYFTIQQSFILQNLTIEQKCSKKYFANFFSLFSGKNAKNRKINTTNCYCHSL